MNKLLPVVRFNSYFGDWDKNKLKNLASFSKGKGYTKSDLTEQGQPIILYGRLYTKYEAVINSVDTFAHLKDNSILSEGDEVIVPGSGETSEDISRASVIGESGIIIGGDLNVIKPTKKINSIFLALTISNGRQQKELSKRAQGNSVVHLYNSNLKEVSIIFPEKEEQEKIGSFFNKLDKTITLQQQLLDDHKQLKKAMMQKMFPRNEKVLPRIRFDKFTDNWNKISLSSVLKERNIKQVPEKDSPLVSFSVEKGVTPKTKRYERDFLVRASNKKYKLTKYNDIVYNPANLKFGAISRNAFGTAVFSPIYITFETQYNPEFIELIVTNPNFINRALKYQEGTVYERKAVKPKAFLTIFISLPSKEEQKAIVNIFRELDSKINIYQKKLETYQELKKAMLQKMFV